MLDQSNLSVQRCRLIFWVECSVGGYLALARLYVYKYNCTVTATEFRQSLSLGVKQVLYISNPTSEFLTRC
jgi:hypothetical protein